MVTKKELNKIGNILRTIVTIILYVIGIILTGIVMLLYIPISFGLWISTRKSYKTLWYWFFSRTDKYFRLNDCNIYTKEELSRLSDN